MLRIALSISLLWISLLGIAAAGETEPPRNSLVLSGAMLFDSHTGEWHSRQTIVISGDRISAVLPDELAPEFSEDLTRIDCTERYVIPGLIDAHVHLVHLADRTRVTGDEILPLFLAAGVTSVRSTGDEIVAATGVAHFAETRPEQSPRVFLASPLIDGDPPVHADVGYALTDPARVPAFIEDMAEWNVVTLKIYVGTPREIGKLVIDHGHRHGMKVTGHLGAYSAQDAAIDGIDCLEHIWSVFNYSIPPGASSAPDYRANLDLNNSTCQDLIALLVNRRVAVDPTLVVFRNMIYLNDLPQVHNHADLEHVPARMLRYWESYRAGSALKPETQPTRLGEVGKYQELTGLLHRAGVPLLVGTDAPEPYVVPGFALHQELEMLVESGLSPAAALQSATINTARLLNQAENLGSIEPGKLADLVVLTADPTADIGNTRRIDNVIRGGHICKPAELLKLVPAE